MAPLRERQTWRITFQQNCDVYYEISQDDFKSRVFRHIVDYPISKIEVDDIESIHPIYISELSDGKTLIEIKEYPKRINLKYVKKEFLKKESNSENKILLKYLENIQMDVSDDIAEFCLLIHSPYSFISAIRKLSTSKFNNHSFEPGDLYPIFIKQSGTMELDWTLEIIDISAETNYDRKRQYLNDSTQKQTFLKLEENYDNGRLYKWIDILCEKFRYDRPPKEENLNSPLILEDVLNGSCFYLSAGSDITPIMAFQDKIRTYIFCDEYGCFENSKRSIKDKWLIIDEKLQKQNFTKLGTYRVNEKSFEIFNSPSRCRLENISMSFWKKYKKTFCLIYFNWENSLTFHNLYVKNKIIPKAICEILPDGGSIGKHSRIQIPYRFRMPEYSIGHNYSVGKHDEYELVLENLKYFGEYGPEYGSDSAKYLFRRKRK